MPDCTRERSRRAQAELGIRVQFPAQVHARLPGVSRGTALPGSPCASSIGLGTACDCYEFSLRCKSVCDKRASPSTSTYSTPLYSAPAVLYFTLGLACCQCAFSGVGKPLRREPSRFLVVISLTLLYCVFVVPRPHSASFTAHGVSLQIISGQRPPRLANPNDCIDSSSLHSSL